MAKFLFWSDLHCEFAPFDIPTPGQDGAPTREEVDGVLIAGDIAVKGAHVDWLTLIWEKWQCPVLAVAGNHEPYGAKRFQKHLAEERERIAELRAAGVDIDVMRCATRVIGDTRIIGATLWTDMKLYPELAPYASVWIRERMNDYRAVKWHDEARGIYRKLIPEDTIAMHLAELDYIIGQLATPFEGRTVVLTHHAPVMQVLHPRRLQKRETISAAYASDLWPRLGHHKIDAWISGHTHDGVEVSLEGAQGPTAFLSNQRGYPFEITHFEPNRVLDSNAPLVGSTIDPARPHEWQVEL